MAKTKILFVGAIGGMAYATRIANESGYEPVVADYYPDSQAKEFTDKKYLVSTLDTEALKKIVEEEKITAIFTGFSDNNIQSAQKLCSFYGFPTYITEKQLEILQNKLEFKKLCLKYGIPVPHEYEEDGDICFPVIVKPSDAYAAKGITVCQNKEELIAAVEKAKAVSRNDKVVIEDYLDGREAMVHFVMLNGKLKITSVLDRILSSSFKNEKKNLAPLIIYNCERYVKKVESYAEKIERMFLDLGFENLIGFFQGIWYDDEIYFFEPAVRFGGNVSEIFNVKANGVNIIKKFIDYSATGVMDDSDIEKIDPLFDGFYCNLTFFLKEGEIAKICGEKETFALDGVMDVQRFCSPGDEITSKKTNSYAAIAYRLVISLNDKNELKDLITKIHEVLRVEDVNGKDMIDWDLFDKILSEV